MTQLSTQTAENHRFQQLLDPIRDLTENWNIDLASQLEEYLEEIEQVEITFDNGKSQIDFVQAALLIQGSTHVFSRKVEYLYTLVVQTLDLLSSQKKLEQVTNSPHPTSRAHNQTTFDLLTLDDVPTRDSELKESILVKDTRLIPETPTALLANTSCVPATPLYNTSREVIGHRQDFHLLTAIPHHSGTLLLEPSLASFLNTEPFNTTAISPHDACMHGDDGGSGYDSPGCPDSPSTPHRSAPPSSVINLPHTASIAQLFQSGDANNEKNLSVGSLANPLMNLLNPYDTMPGSEKPFKKGKTYRIPPSLQVTAVPAKRKREPQTETIGLIEHLTHNLWSGKNQFPKNSLLQLSFLPLEQKYWEEVKRRGEALKKLQRNAALQRSRADSSMPISKFYSHLGQQLDRNGWIHTCQFARFWRDVPLFLSFLWANFLVPFLVKFFHHIPLFRNPCMILIDYIPPCPAFIMAQVGMYVHRLLLLAFIATKSFSSVDFLLRSCLQIEIMNIFLQTLQHRSWTQRERR